MIAENTKAPDFTLPDSEGNKVSLSAFTGKKVLLVFYPADDSPVCTTQLCSYRDNYTEFTRRGITILGISTDSSLQRPVFSHSSLRWSEVMLSS